MSDIFMNQINLNTFRATNWMWNELSLNAPWSEGYVSRLIEHKSFHSKEAWRDYYYTSGKDRQAKISQLPHDLQCLLNTHRPGSAENQKLPCCQGNCET